MLIGMTEPLAAERVLVLIWRPGQFDWFGLTRCCRLMQSKLSVKLRVKPLCLFHILIKLLLYPHRLNRLFELGLFIALGGVSLKEVIANVEVSLG